MGMVTVAVPWSGQILEGIMLAAQVSISLGCSFTAPLEQSFWGAGPSSCPGALWMPEAMKDGALCLLHVIAARGQAQPGWQLGGFYS